MVSTCPMHPKNRWNGAIPTLDSPGRPTDATEDAAQWDGQGDCYWYQAFLDPNGSSDFSLGIPFPKLNSSPLKSYLPNNQVVFQPSFFRGYVKTSGGLGFFYLLKTYSRWIQRTGGKGGFRMTWWSTEGFHHGWRWVNPTKQRTKGCRFFCCFEPPRLIVKAFTFPSGAQLLKESQQDVFV